MARIGPNDGTVETAVSSTSTPASIRDVVTTDERVYVYGSTAESDFVRSFSDLQTPSVNWSVPRPDDTGRTASLTGHHVGDRLVQLANYRSPDTRKLGIDVRNRSGTQVAQAVHDGSYTWSFVEDGQLHLLGVDGLDRVDLETGAIERETTIDANVLVPTTNGYLGISVESPDTIVVRRYDGSVSPRGERRRYSLGFDHNTASISGAAALGDRVVLSVTGWDAPERPLYTWLGAIDGSNDLAWERSFDVSWGCTDVLSTGSDGYLLAGWRRESGWILGGTGPPDHSTGVTTSTPASTTTDTTRSTTHSGTRSTTDSGTDSTDKTGTNPGWIVGGAIALGGLVYGAKRYFGGDRDS